MNTELMFSSESTLWSTPQGFFNELDSVFHFELDVCADKQNTKCDFYLTEEEDGLASDWGYSVCWMNPPYGRGITGKWLEKAYNSSKDGATVVCLIPARTDTKWWHEWCTKGEIYFVKGRLKFGTSKNSAPFPSAIVIFRPKIEDCNIELIKG